MRSSTVPSEAKQHKPVTDDVTISRLAAIGQISAGIAHEVRNPLTAVQGFLQLLQEQHPHRYLDLAQAELSNAIETLQNLLSVSKPDLIGEPYVDINLCAELESLLSLFQDKSYHIDFHCDFSDANVLITGKRNQIKRALFNLIKNAIEAMDGHGALILRHQMYDDKVRVTIQDTGPGIPEEKLAILGTPFFTTKSSGTGMGLAQVFATTYQHGGTISVTSEIGQGACFLLEFPIKSRADIGVTHMEMTYQPGQTLVEFYRENEASFLEQLKEHAASLVDAVKMVSPIDEMYILNAARTMVNLLNDQNEHGLILEAKAHGKTWARHELALLLKLEWYQTLRKLYLDLLYHYDKLREAADMEEEFQTIERAMYSFDSYVKHFSESYSEWKSEQIHAQNAMIDDLSVPVIPLTTKTAILPMVGTIDTHRAKRIQEVALQKISEFRIEQLLIDMSGVAFMDTAVTGHMFRIIEGIGLLGCKPVLTGLRPEIVHTLIDQGIKITDKVDTVGTLQQAIQAVGLHVQG